MSHSLQTLSVDQLRSPDPKISQLVAHAINVAFGPAGPGILLVNGLDPDFISHSATLFDAGCALAALPSHQLKPLEFAAHHFVGWSRGTEKFKGKVDSQKASFYANPLYDHPAGGNTRLLASYPHYMTPNVWPTHTCCAQLEQSFKNVGTYVHRIALFLAHHCDRFVQTHLGHSVKFSRLHHLLSTSKSAKARLLNYFPDDHPESAHTTTHPHKMWCGYHNDHGSLTGLLPGRFYSTKDLKPLPGAPDHVAGLYVCREGRSERVVIPNDCIAFQIGEACQIASGGVLRATPHAVVMPHCSPDVARITMAVFLQPDPWNILDMPQGLSEVEMDEALSTDSVVPQLKGRYQMGDSYQEFSARTGKAYTA